MDNQRCHAAALAEPLSRNSQRGSPSTPPFPRTPFSPCCLLPALTRKKNSKIMVAGGVNRRIRRVLGDTPHYSPPEAVRCPEIAFGRNPYLRKNAAFRQMLHLRYENTRRFGPLLAGSAKMRLSGRATASRPKTRLRGRNEGAGESVVATQCEARFIVAIIDKNGFAQF